MDQQMFQTTVLDQLRALREDNASMRNEVNLNRAELKGDIGNLRTEMHDLRVDVQDLRNDMRNNSSKLDEIYASRKYVKVKFGWEWSVASMVIAVMAAGITHFLLKIISI